MASEELDEQTRARYDELVEAERARLAAEQEFQHAQREAQGGFTRKQLLMADLGKFDKEKSTNERYARYLKAHDAFQRSRDRAIKARDSYDRSLRSWEARQRPPQTTPHVAPRPAPARTPRPSDAT